MQVSTDSPVSNDFPEQALSAGAADAHLRDASDQLRVVWKGGYNSFRPSIANTVVSTLVSQRPTIHLMSLVSTPPIRDST